MQYAIIATALAAVATTQSVAQDVDREHVRLELQAWKASPAGVYAKSQGFYSDFTFDGEDDHLDRFLSTKAEIARLSAEHPDALFSTESPFTLWTNEEFERYVKRANGPRPHRDSNEKISVIETQNNSLRGLQDSNGVDWMKSGCVAPVKNQGRCGSCWAFAGVATIEYAHCAKTGKLTLLSEQQITSCSHEFGSDGCNGGWSDDGITFTKKNGICTDSDYPYISGTTKNSETCKVKSCDPVKVDITKIGYVKEGEDELTAALNNQPVSVYVSAGNTVWKQYKSGIVDSCPSKDTDHAVLAVGYGTDEATYSAYYRIKNSWSATWGDQGFMYLRRGVGGTGTCEIASEPMFAGYK